MNDWKRAGNVSFGSGVRCKQLTLNGAIVTVYCDQAEIDRVEEALSPDAVKVQQIGQKDPIYIVGNGDREQVQELPVNPYSPDDFAAKIKDLIAQDKKSK